METENGPIELNAVQARVLGALMEKERTTPNGYPLSLNGVVVACNQRSNREPVMALEEGEVVRGLDRLRGHGLVVERDTVEGRVVKYAHTAKRRLALTPEEGAVLCLLLLRGPQTPGELRGRSGRLHPFANVADVEAALARLQERPAGPLAVRLERLPGHREHRYAHLLCGAAAVEVAVAAATAAPVTTPGTAEARLATVEVEVAELRDAVEVLRAELDGFRRQFE